MPRTPHIIDMRYAAPSTIAASTTWPFARAARFEHPAHHAEGQEHAAAAEVADHVDRRRGRLPGAPEVRERAGERDVVDVVTGGLRERTVLAPPGHAPVHEPRVAREAHVGPEPESLGDAGPVPLDERVGPLHQPQHGLDAVGVLEVDGDVAATAPRRRRTRSAGSSARRASTRSTRTTSAPMSDSNIPANGPGPIPASSTTLTPCSGPTRVPSLDDAARTMPLKGCDTCREVVDGSPSGRPRSDGSVLQRSVDEEVDPLVEERDPVDDLGGVVERFPVAPREVGLVRQPTSTTLPPCTRSRSGDRSGAGGPCAHPRGAGSSGPVTAARTTGRASSSRRAPSPRAPPARAASCAGRRPGGRDHEDARRCARPPRTRRRTRRSRASR